MNVDYSALGAQLAALPADRPIPSGPRLNAVCLLLFDAPQAHLLAIQKTATADYPWAGDIALPGGGIEPQDPTLLDAALRELHEELAIPPHDVEPCGLLGRFLTSTTHQELAVVVGRWLQGHPPVANPAEVACVVRVPLADLTVHHRRQGFHTLAAASCGARELTYPTPRGAIWGVTARIVHALVERLGI